MLGSHDLVGRDAELVVVEDALAAASAGRAALVLCWGEAGIGKTRLAEELADRAHASGFVVAWGIADDSVGTPPHWPWTQVLRGLAAALAAQGSLEGGGLRADLDRVLSVGAAAPVDVPAERFQLYDAVTSVLRRAADLHPLAIVLEDLHWADDESILLLRHLAVAVGSAPLALWVTARRGERDDRLTWWDRLPGSRELQLRGLDDEGVRQQIESLTGAVVGSDAAQRVRARTAGNPLLVREAARSLADADDGGGTSIPPGLRAAVGARLHELSGETGELLRIAAVLGREIDGPLLAVVAGITEPACTEAMLEAGRAGLVEPLGPPGGFRFVHALVRDAIEDGLTPDDRVQLHLRAAAALEAGWGTAPGAHTFAIAHHRAAAASGGDDREVAAAWLERAADLALSQLGYEAAARLYQQALDVGGPTVEPRQRGRLLLGAASARNRSGALGECHRLRMAAVEVAPDDARVEVVTGAALVMDPSGQAGFDLVTRRLCEEVLAALPPDPTPERARVTARFAETFLYLPDSDAADRASAEALAVADASGDAPAVVAALRARQVVVAHPDRLDERLVVADRLVAAGREGGRVDVELRGRLCRIDAWFERGELARIGPELDVGEALAEATQSPLSRYLVAHTRAVLAQAQGRVLEAARVSAEAFARGGWGDHPEPTHRRTAVLSGIARLAGYHATAPPPEPPDGPKPPFIADVAAANAMVGLGQPAGALDVWLSLGPPAQWQPPAHVVLLGFALGLETAIALDRADDVAALAARLDVHRGHHVACGLGAASYLGPVELWLGKAALHLRHLDDAAAELEVAVDRSRASGAAGAELEATADLATARLAQGRAEEAAALVAAGLLPAEQLGLAAIARRLRDLADRASPAAAGPLTAREREVAELVAAGLSNREIAERLIVSERTAQNHVQHILTKLGLRNRTQIARWYQARDE